MLHKNAIPFLVMSACIITGSVIFQRHLSHQVLYLESALLSEDKLYYDLLLRKSIAVKDRIKMRESYTDSFTFIFPLFATINPHHAGNYRPSEIDLVLNRLAENSILRRIRTDDPVSTLEVFDEAFELILAHIDSCQIAQRPTEIPSLIVEEYSQSNDSCTISMTPLSSYHIPDSVLTYYHGQIFPVDSLPFTFEGNPDALRIITKDGRDYGSR